LKTSFYSMFILSIPSVPTLSGHKNGHSEITVAPRNHLSSRSVSLVIFRAKALP
jgi:hypothetical protein